MRGMMLSAFKYVLLLDFHGTPMKWVYCLILWIRKWALSWEVGIS